MCSTKVDLKTSRSLEDDIHCNIAAGQNDKNTIDRREKTGIETKISISPLKLNDTCDTMESMGNNLESIRSSDDDIHDNIASLSLAQNLVTEQKGRETTGTKSDEKENRGIKIKIDTKIPVSPLEIHDICDTKDAMGNDPKTIVSLNDNIHDNIANGQKIKEKVDRGEKNGTGLKIPISQLETRDTSDIFCSKGKNLETIRSIEEYIQKNIDAEQIGEQKYEKNGTKTKFFISPHEMNGSCENIGSKGNDFGTTRSLEDDNHDNIGAGLKGEEKYDKRDKNGIETKITINSLEIHDDEIIDYMGNNHESIESSEDKIHDNLAYIPSLSLAVNLVSEQKRREAEKDNSERTENEGNEDESVISMIPLQINGNDSERIGINENNLEESNPSKSTKRDVDLGIIQKVLNVCLNRSHATFLTILLLILFSCGDSGTDLGMAHSFYKANFTTEAYFILATDYLPVILTLIHFFMSSMRSSMTLRLQLLLAAVFIILNPFMPAMCNFAWLVSRMSGSEEIYFHYLAKLTSGINGSFEVRMFLCHTYWKISLNQL